MNVKNAQYWIDQLGLSPHPEGGFYRSTYVSNDLEITRGEHKRKLYTSIYFLLRSSDVSHFHRLKSDELWYFHGGSSLTIHVIDESGEYHEWKLGLNLENGEMPQVLVPKNSIFGSSLTETEKDSFSLVGCMVSPGFDFEDFDLFNQDELLNQYPQHEQIIRKMAYKSK